MDTQKLIDYENNHQHWPVFSYSGGPTQLPRYVMHKVQNSLLNYNDTGISILETNSYSKEFHQILQQANDDLRYLYQVPQDFRIIFCAGGGTLLFDAIPLNLLKGKSTASYLNTGYWSRRAINEAKIICPRVHQPTEIKQNDKGLYYVPEMSEWNYCDETAYLHYCDNETVEGVEYQFCPKIPGIPLVSDMSSNFLTRHVDWTQTDLVYAHAQKNIGISGSAIMIIRESLIDQNKVKNTPYMCDFEEMLKQQSLINTLPVFPIYINQQVFSWMKQQGNVNYWEHITTSRSKPIYDIIDQSHGFYRCPIVQRWRSRINITFNLETVEKTKEFLDYCESQNMIEIQGHRSLGGCRVSLYVPVPQIAIDKLAHVMSDYCEKRQS